MKPSGPMPTKSSVRASRRKATSSRSSASDHSPTNPPSCLVQSSIVSSLLRWGCLRIAESSAPCGCRSVHDPASHPVERDAGYPGGALGGGEKGGERDVLGIAQPPQGYLLSHLKPPLLRNHAAGALDEHRMRGQAVDPHTVLGATGPSPSSARLRMPSTAARSVQSAGTPTA